MAQLGARLNGIEEVVGSNPTGSTLKRFEQSWIGVGAPIRRSNFLDANEEKASMEWNFRQDLKCKMIIAIAQNGDYSKEQ
jgi:hypothetical protein